MVFSNSFSLLTLFSIFTFVYQPFVLSTPAIPGTLPFDGNEILNKDLDSKIFQNIGQYSPRFTVEHDSIQPPFGCKIEVINSLERHGVRYMTSSALSSAQKTLTKIQSALNNSKSISSDLEFFIGYTLLQETSDLAPYGALQAWYSGRSTASNYPLLSHNKSPFVRASGDESTLDDRVIQTAKYWTLGFEGKDFPSQSLQNGQDVRTASVKFTEPNVIFSELSGVNNTLDVDTCTNSNNIPDSEGEKGAQIAFTTSTILPTFGKELQNRFIRSGAPSTFNLTATDILNLAELCSFETLGRANVTKGGSLKIKQSQFCNLYNSTEWKSLGYALDYGKWKGAGYGNPYYKALGTGFLRELIARFTSTKPPLQQPTSLNSTIDGNPKQFPLPNAVKGPTVYFDGSHDNQIGPIAAAAGLFNGPALSSSQNAQLQPHNWYFSHIAPLQGKIVFEKLSCFFQEEEYVRIRANEAIINPKTYCQNRFDKKVKVGNHIWNSLCPLKTFVNNLDFVNQDQEWNKCY